MKTNLISWPTIITLVITTLSGLASAQEKTGNSLALEEVTVTARKRDETLLNIPLTISVVTAADIELKDIKNLRDVVDYTPGFYFGGPSGGAADRSSARLIMRGMQVNTDVQTRQGAMVFIDGAPVLGAQIGGTENAERIETVKGPQSAYFGRSTFGGAINVITRNPSTDNWQAKANLTTGSYSTSNRDVQIEGPLLQDKLSMRLTASSLSKDGSYKNFNGGGTLGDRKTEDAAITLYSKPTENLTAKLRVHYWEDTDGPAASVGYGRGNGEDVFNCNPGKGAVGTAKLINGNNWVCGEPRFPTSQEIAYDTTMDPNFLKILAGDATPCATCGLLLGPNFLTSYGLRRKANEASLAIEYNFSNGMTLSSISARHEDKMARIDDLDRRSTAALGDAFNPQFFSARALKDFSQELRLSSASNEKLRWLIGASYSDIEQLTLGVSRNVQKIWTSGTAGISLNQVKTKGIFASLSYEITDKLTANLEGRRQEDEVTDGAEPFTQLNGVTSNQGITLSGTFKSTTPRLILDYKPNKNITFYGIYAEGNRPGEFNSNLVPTATNLIDSTVQACIGAAIFGGIAIPEEELKNFEVGMKGRFLDGRLIMTAAAYKSLWRKQHNRGQTICPNSKGVLTTYQSTGLGGSTDLDGIEMDMKFAATEHLTIESTFAINNTKILSRDCADCLLILGFREIAGLSKEFSRYPPVSGTLSGFYERRLSQNSNWFARLDYIRTGSQYATEANLAETGVGNRMNLRFGLLMDKGLRVEVYGNNITNDKTFTGFQRFDDQINSGYQLLTAGLPDKPSYGLRLSYKFNAARLD